MTWNQTMNYLIILRAVQFLFALLVFILACVTVSGIAFSSASFMVFAGLWAMLSLIYILLTPHFLPSIHNGIAVLGLECVNVIFFLAGFIAMADQIAPFNCDIFSSVDSTVNYSSSFTAKYRTSCQTAKAVAVFGAFSFVLWTASLVAVGMAFHSSVRGSSRSNAIPAPNATHEMSESAGVAK